MALRSCQLLPGGGLLGFYGSGSAMSGQTLLKEDCPRTMCPCTFNRMREKKIRALFKESVDGKLMSLLEGFAMPGQTLLRKLSSNRVSLHFQPHEGKEN
ncbi:hypothetical protein CEXT_588101 [Caerostris extrusa]|uniref:Uncharacterized protein n=1 Tax=Caerostris extrusa TaxID=172846 RepID=A0AAV4XEE5_CAEEX|nr:hypothetical protein CEXT_588101 [Caerostris extrusa]